MTPDQLETEAELLYLEQRPQRDPSLCWCCGQSMFGGGRFDLVRDMQGAQQIAHKRCAMKYGQNQRMYAGPQWAEISQIAKTLWRGRVLTGELAELG
jgi:hypothetical protein